MRHGRIRVPLIAAAVILAITAVPGGAMLLLGIYAPPAVMLRGSLFETFTVPGLALSLGVGGSALAAAVLLLRGAREGFFAAAVAGLILLTFEFIQVLSIGSPPGSARTMQAAYFALGLLLVVLALAGLRAERAAE